MTTHFIAITILPDPDFSHAHLMGALLSKLHRALVQLKSEHIGVSFPQHVNVPISQRTLGSMVRLHGTEQVLQMLMDIDWLKGIRDHIAVSEIALTPANASHRIVQRKQFKTSVQRLRRRRMMRKGESVEQARQAIPQRVERAPDLPFANLRSLSTGQLFSLFVLHGPMLEQPLIGAFSSYGLSQGASVPWF